MFFGRINRLRHSLAFRLTLWYAVIFVMMAGIAFSLCYVLIDSAIRERVDSDLVSQARELEGIYVLEGIDMLQRAAKLQVQTTGEKEMFYRLLYTSGLVFSASNMFYWKHVKIDRPAVESVIRGMDHIYTTESASDGKRRVRIIYTRIGSGIVLQLGYSPTKEDQLLKSFQRIFMLTITVLLILAMGVGWFMARRALSGVESLTRTAGQISKDDLHSRVPILQRHNEIDRLAVTFNQMLDRIQSLVVGIQQMNDNIAHDLRSPITRIRGLAEVTLLNAGQIDDYSQMAASAIEECDRLLDMINTMLTISRTESGVNPIERSYLDLGTMVHEACDLFRALAEDRHIRLEYHVDGQIGIHGDRNLLQRLVANLLDNAIKYTGEGGQIVVQLLRASSSEVLLDIRDNGIGIPLKDQERIFDRFFRCDQSRSQGGAGLGLSLARTIARAHGGDIGVTSQAGEGSTFSVRLPMAG
jgi:heavy metal sensor kinase